MKWQQTSNQKYLSGKIKYFCHSHYNHLTEALHEVWQINKGIYLITTIKKKKYKEGIKMDIILLFITIKIVLLSIQNLSPNTMMLPKIQ
jgi:hypothetical protein